MKLIVGLGNPGPRYAGTRHNVGFQVISELAKAHQIKISGSLGPAIFGRGRIGGHEVLLLQPTTFMNRSGAAVAYALNRHQLNLEDILVIYDDLDLPLGKIRLRANGSAGGHKGIGSIITKLESQEINRLRVGIGRPQFAEVVDYVLQPFSKAEIPLARDAVVMACDAVAIWLEEGPVQAASQFNAR